MEQGWDQWVLPQGVSIQGGLTLSNPAGFLPKLLCTLSGRF